MPLCCSARPHNQLGRPLESGRRGGIIVRAAAVPDLLAACVLPRSLGVAESRQTPPSFLDQFFSYVQNRVTWATAARVRDPCNHGAHLTSPHLSSMSRCQRAAFSPVCLLLPISKSISATFLLAGTIRRLKSPFSWRLGVIFTMGLLELFLIF